jgi:hypothetical protein
LTCNAAYWLRVVPLLDGFRAIALDLGGHGLSEHDGVGHHIELEAPHDVARAIGRAVGPH